MTDLVQFQQQMPAFLQSDANANAALDEFSAGVAGGMPLAALSFRGKEWRIRKDGQEFNTRQRDLLCVLVASRPYVSKRFFAQSYSSGEATAPDCASVDGQTPDVPEPVSPKCATCPKNAWGSQITASGKQGKACNDYKRIVVLPIIQNQAMKEPCVLDVPATSLKTPKGYQGNDLFLREYMGLLSKHKIPPYGVVTQIGFTDAEYPQLQFQLSHYVSQELYQFVQQLRGEEDVREVLDAPVHETAGTIAEASQPPVQGAAQVQPEQAPQPQAQAAPQPEPQPAPQAQAPQPEPQPAPQPVPQAQAQPDPQQPDPQQASGPQPVPDPVPQQEQPTQQQSDAGEDDILSELDSILGG